MNKSPFPYLHIALYAKQQYSRTGNIWNDIDLCLQKEGHAPLMYPFEERSYIVERMAKRVMPFMGEHRLSEFLRHCSPQQCHRVGYYTQHATWLKSTDVQIYEYWEAVLHALLSEIANATLEELGINELPEPSIPELMPKEIETIK